ncbi:MAG: hypothetical protein WCO12_03720 [bacterium]
MQTFFTNLGRALWRFLVSFLYVFRVIFVDGVMPIARWTGRQIRQFSQWVWRGRSLIARVVIVFVSLFAIGCALVWFGDLLNSKGVEEIDRVKVFTPKPTKPAPTAVPILVIKKVAKVTSVEDHSPDAKWDPVQKVFRHQNGNGSSFITRPYIFMWNDELNPMRWTCPFDEFARMYPDEAQRILRSQPVWHVKYWRWDAVVKKYGRQALPPSQYRR